MYSDFLFCPEGENKKLAEHFGQSHIVTLKFLFAFLQLSIKLI